MFRTCTGLLAGMLMVTASGDAMAQALGWRVSETSGQVTIRNAGQARPAQRGVALQSGDTVETGGNGRAVLVHARDFVTVAANSRVAVPAAEEATGLTKLMQSLGNAVYRIQKLGKPHFGVKTPYLAAVVKGTTFSVTVDGAGSSLQVTEGLVEVATPDGGARDMIRPGSVATVDAADMFRLRVRGDTDRSIDSPSRPASSPAAAVPTPNVVVALAAPVQVGESAAEPMDSAAIIGEAIASKPVDLGAETRGLVTGSTGAMAELAAVTSPREEIAAAVAAMPAAPVSTAPPPAPIADTAAAEAARAQAEADAAKKAADDAAVAKAAADAAQKRAEDAARDAAEAAARAKADADREAERAAQDAAKKAADEAKKASDAQAEADRLAREKAETDQAREKAEREKADKDKADKDKADKDAKDKADKDQADKDAKDRADKDQADKDAKDKADREQADKDAKDRADKDRADKDAKEKADKDQADKDARDKAEKDKADKDKHDHDHDHDHDDDDDRDDDDDDDRDDDDD